ncbi:hypothetical protein [Blastopirellula marina]|uniref:hypothetical protein n=1 Tax=Blastopirellula marina TaxID=124 RepID=UPI0011B08321|nr:hypothetical protein [Blastopirellula marina]
MAASHGAVIDPLQDSMRRPSRFFMTAAEFFAKSSINAAASPQNQLRRSVAALPALEAGFQVRPNRTTVREMPQAFAN